MPGILTTPRPVPESRVPALAGTAVVLLALPVFLIAGWPLAGWGLAAALWAAGQVLGIVLGRLPIGAGNLGASGVVGFGRMFRAVALTVVLIAVAVSNPRLALAAAVLYALAYTVELGLSILAYFGGEARG